jgi:hypothetical protein
MGQMIGTMGSPGVEGARPSPNFMGPMPAEGAVAPSGILGGVKKLTDFASFLGDSPEERADNAKKFAALVKDVGNTVSDVSDSTLMQRMMKEQMGGPSYIGEGGSPSGGVSAIPRTFDPQTAGQIMSKLGFK